MRAILTFSNGKLAETELITIPGKPIFVERIKRKLMDEMNAQLTNAKVTKVHILRN